MGSRESVWQAPAKVNLYLEVCGQRPDGFHEIRTVFQTIDLVDRLVITPAPRGVFELTATDPALSCGEDNLVTRAFRRLEREAGLPGGARVHLEKRIPDRAGLGGGSSDAAAMLTALDDLYALGLGAARLEGLAADLGSDVAFFVRGGTAFGEGRGERLTRWPALAAGAFWIGVPTWRLKTADVYRTGAFAKPGSDRLESLRRGIEAGALDEVARGLFNALELAALTLEPGLAGAFGLLGRVFPGFAAPALPPPSLGALLCGSGSALFALDRDREGARRLHGDPRLGAAFPTTFVALPRAHGVTRVA